MKFDSNFFKENYVIGVGVLQALLVLSFLFINSDGELFLLLLDGLIFFEVIIFVIWLRDKKYKFLYYFFYVLIAITFRFISLKFLLPSLAININSITSMIIFIALLCIFDGIILQFAYNFFKKMSYSKN
jgi:hypothetical protein